MVSSTLGSLTSTGWNLLSSAGSFSIYFLYSFSVVAPMARNSPRASAGFSMLEASIEPSAAPAPTSVCNSSMNRIICPSDCDISFSTAFRRSSNSPRNFAPATNAAKSRATSRLVFNTSGTSPETMRCAKPSAIAVLPTPGSPIRTGLFLVRRARICITRRISSSRPMTGSSFCRRANSVRSRAYLSSASYVASGFCEVTRCVPRTPVNACRIASWEAPWRFSNCPAGSRSRAAIARNRCSVDTYSSLKLSASLNERSSTSFRGRPMCCCAKPCTFGKRPISRSISCVNPSVRIPSLDSNGGTTPSAWATSAASKWTGSICWFSWLAAISCALCTASWAFTVIFSNRSIRASLPPASAAKGWRVRPALQSYHSSSAGLLRCRSGHRLGVHIDFDLLWLGFFALRDGQSQHPVLVIGLNRVRIHGIRQREAPGERAIRALHTQVVFFLHLLLELAFTANRQDVVLHADVQILGIDFRQIGLHHEFMLGLVDIHGRSPGSEAGFLAFPVEDIIKETIELVLQGVDPAEGFPSSNGSHL